MAVRRWLLVQALAAAIAVAACKDEDQVVAVVCASTLDCAENLVCRGGVCTRCQGSEECPGGLVCKDGECRSCTADQDCGDPDANDCGPGGRCYPRACTDSAQCVDGRACQAGLCDEPRRCESPAACLPPRVLVRGLCLPEACTVDAQCPGRQICAGRECVDPPAPLPGCRQDTQCRAGRICRGEVCVNALPPCQCDAECPDGQVCEAGTCAPQAADCHPLLCRGGRVCDSGACADAQPRDCFYDVHCVGEQKCLRGECRPADWCAVDGDCAGGARCVAGAEGGHCVSRCPELAPAQISARDCRQQTCEGRVVRTQPDDLEVPWQFAADDCSRQVCQGGAALTVPEDTEVPPQAAAGDCKRQVCSGGKAIDAPADEEEPPQESATDCKKQVCEGGQVVTEDADGESLAQISPGDCKRQACSGGKAIDAPADEEEPPQESATDCRMQVCEGGEVVSEAADAETPAQVSAADCKRQACSEGAVANVAQDSEAPAQEATDDCRREVCQGGNIVRLADDGESPPRHPVACVKSWCQGGDARTQEDHGFCDDLDPCNGEELCSLAQAGCVAGAPLPNGTWCGENPSKVCAAKTCTTSGCGDGIRDPRIEEVCDNTDLAGQTCASLTYTRGKLGCAMDCKTFDTSKCVRICEGDLDCDGIPDAGDNCLATFNPDQLNSDRGRYLKILLRSGYICVGHVRALDRNGQPIGLRVIDSSETLYGYPIRTLEVYTCARTWAASSTEYVWLLYEADPAVEIRAIQIRGEHGAYGCVAPSTAEVQHSHVRATSFSTLVPETPVPFSSCWSIEFPVVEAGDACDVCRYRWDPGQENSDGDCAPPFWGPEPACGDACQGTTSICGDALKQPLEQCDDGNSNDFDDCSRSCQAWPSCPADLRAYWTFDSETEDARIADSILGTVGDNLGAERGLGVVNRALRFPAGTGAYALSPHTAATALGTMQGPGATYTVEAWVRFPANGGGTVVDKSTQGASTPSYPFWLRADEVGATFTVGYGAITHAAALAGALDDDRWHHLVGVRDGASYQLRLYVDGRSEVVDDIPVASASNSAPLSIGRRAATQNDHFAGWIDELALYGRALSDAEIFQHHRNGFLGLGYCQVGPDRVCGDGIVELSEECDDKNRASGDGCNDICKIE